MNGPMPRAPADWRGIVRRNRELAQNQGPRALDELLAAFRWRYDTARNAAVEAVASLGPWTVPRLIRVLREAGTAVERRAAADALGLVRDQRAVPHLMRALKDPNMVVRRAAMVSLWRLGARTAVPSIARLLKDESGGVRVLAAEVLGEFRARSSAPSLIRALRDPKWYVRQVAARALGKVGDPRAVPPLVRAARDRRKAVAQAAQEALLALRADPAA